MPTEEEKARYKAETAQIEAHTRLLNAQADELESKQKKGKKAHA